MPFVAINTCPIYLTAAAVPEKYIVERLEQCYISRNGGVPRHCISVVLHLLSAISTQLGCRAEPIMLKYLLIMLFSTAQEMWQLCSRNVQFCSKLRSLIK